MSANKERPHVFVLPEDDANLQLANEFLANVDFDRQRQMYVLDVAGGWTRVLDLFHSVHVSEMSRWPQRHMILLIDFDGNPERLERANAKIPSDLNDRVFIIGVLTKPEDLRQQLGQSYEKIGSALADDCRDGTDVTWACALLRHNASELERLRQRVRPILFA